MAMAGKIRFSFQMRVFLTVLTLCWLLVGVFMVLQYHREKEFKASLLDARLQMHNDRIIEDIRQGQHIEDIVARIGTPVKDLRVTLIDRDGNVLYDNNKHIPLPSTNHNDRPEIKDARAYGAGHAVERLSESDDVNYFYSARLGEDGMVVRSAAPYTHSLVDFLKADSTLLWIMAALTLVMSLAVFLSTHTISLSITRLNRFAEKAERGERIFNDEAFPNDELGSIASNIVQLYVQRDEQHRKALRLEQDKIRLKKQLTNNINHELKTPVASILLCLDLLDDHPELETEKKRGFMEKIRVNARRLSALLKDVSTITRMDEGANLIKKEEINLTKLIRDIVEEERLRTSMHISLNIPQLAIYGNRILLESIFRNLIDNAIAYSGATEMTITADTNGNFTISDNGCGIPSEHLPHIFERFYRVDKGRSRAAGGTGLGLSIVRNAIAIHGGEIKAESVGGLTYTFQLKVNKNLTKSS
ncbi:MAG: sensor histidine kinase [Prevotellaceae bacterium]|nr:sensor histidine kinase [Prevotellaceae bacterium]